MANHQQVNGFQSESCLKSVELINREIGYVSRTFVELCLDPLFQGSHDIFCWGHNGAVIVVIVWPKWLIDGFTFITELYLNPRLLRPCKPDKNMPNALTENDNE